MRYEVRWSNGYWKLFDTKIYASVDTFGLKTQAAEAWLDANETGRWRVMNYAGRA